MTVGLDTRDQLKTLCYSAVQAKSLPDPSIERLIDHLDAIQKNGVRLGFETSVWHEHAKLNGHACNCARCRP